MKQMKKYLPALLLAIVAALPAAAQSEDAAFYIYQSDGHFDGFFYDQVKEIRYSKLDLEGYEHNSYVCQEIVTPDSTYRIMLEAIDSVSFYQPEIIYNPKLRNMQKEGMLAYLSAKDGQTLTFSGSLPDDKKPRVGDVLVSYEYDLTNDIDNTFGGKVKAVNSQGGLLIVETDELEDLNDVFRQFITVEEICKDDEGEVLSRRVAGMPQLTYRSPTARRVSGDFEGDFLKFTLGGHLPLYNDKVYLDVNISGGTNIKANWNFPLIGKSYAKIITTLTLKASMGITVDGTISDRMPAGANPIVGKVPLPAAAPIFILDFGPDGFAGGQIHAKFSIESPTAYGKVWAMLELDDLWPSVKFGAGKAPGDNSNSNNSSTPAGGGIEGGSGGASLEISGFMQAGLYFPAKVKTNEVFKKIFNGEIGFNFYVGPKISGALNLDLGNVIAGDNTFYNNFKESHIKMNTLSIDWEGGAKMKSLWGDEKEINFVDGSREVGGSITCYAFPRFKNWNISEDSSSGGGGSDDGGGGDDNGGGDDGGSMYRAPSSGNNQTTRIVSVQPTGNVILPVGVGISAYRKGAVNYTNMGSQFANNSYHQMKSGWANGKNKLKMDITNMMPGEYEFRPVFSLLGATITASPTFSYSVPGSYIDFSTEELEFPGIGGTQTVNYEAGPCVVTAGAEDIPAGPKGYEVEVMTGTRQIVITAPEKTGFLPLRDAVQISSQDVDYGDDPVIRSIDIYQKAANVVNEFEFFVETVNPGNAPHTMTNGHWFGSNDVTDLNIEVQEVGEGYASLTIIGKAFEMEKRLVVYLDLNEIIDESTGFPLVDADRGLRITSGTYTATMTREWQDHKQDAQGNLIRDNEGNPIIVTIHEDYELHASFGWTSGYTEDGYDNFYLPKPFDSGGEVTGTETYIRKQDGATVANFSDEVNYMQLRVK